MEKLEKTINLAIEEADASVMKTKTLIRDAITTLKTGQSTAGENLFPQAMTQHATDPYLPIFAYLEGFAHLKDGNAIAANAAFAHAEKIYGKEFNQKGAVDWQSCIRAFTGESPSDPPPLANNAPATHSEDAASNSTRTIIRHDWIQNPRFVFINFYCKSLREEDCIVTFFPRALSVSFTIPNNHERFHFDLPFLHEEVIPEECKYQITPNKLEISLAKRSRNFNWKSLKKFGVDVGDGLSALDRPANIYPSSKNKVDWDVIMKDYDMELKEEIEAKKKDNPMMFMQDIYDQADEETRLAMKKSYITSAGTVLSTNWEEVKNKDYEKEIIPPEGQELRKL